MVNWVILFGITTFSFLIITSVVGYLVLKGKVKFSYHKWLAIITIAIAVVHAFLVLRRFL